MLLASFFNKKAEIWIKSRENWQRVLLKGIGKIEQYCWIHCASAGEFEQAIPLINKIKNRQPRIKIAVSFFSPSGFEMYKNSDFADLYFYFPMDTRRNAEKLVKILNPCFVIFIRNEIWWNVLSSLKEKNIPTYLVNANLKQKRNNFYQYYLNKTYPLFTKVFDTETYGNTKLEKVTENKNTIFSDDIVEGFCNNSFVIILGSSWQTEESFMALFYKKYCKKYPNLKIIIAPHEFDDKKTDNLQNLFGQKISTYTKYSIESTKHSILFLDKKGILKFVYRYANIAFIGGGFEKTVHNISEAAVFGIPTVFGPYFHKFEEAIELVKLQVAFPVNDYKVFEHKLIEVIENNELQKSIKDILQNYFSFQQNVSSKIIDDILNKKRLVLNETPVR
jgi:3-deoxy-D-manno-octulosonic-acid transferase